MILIIDNYDSFTYNLVHLIEQTADACTVVRNNEITLSKIASMQPAGILISPGPGRPEDAGITEEVIRTLGSSTPTLGVCLGHQAIAQVFGGRIVEAPTLMHGKTSIIKHDGRTIFESIPEHFVATRYHSLTVDPESIPQGLVVSALTEDGVVMGLRHRSLPIEGIQFHPESILSEQGSAIIKNWVFTTKETVHA